MAIKYRSFEFGDAASLAHFVQKCNAVGPTTCVVDHIINGSDGRLILFASVDPALLATADLSKLVDQGEGRGLLKIPGTPA